MHMRATRLEPWERVASGRAYQRSAGPLKEEVTHPIASRSKVRFNLI